MMMMMMIWVSKNGKIESMEHLVDRGSSENWMLKQCLCLCVCSAVRHHEVNGQQCEVKKAQSKGDEGFPRSGGGPRGMFSFLMQ